MSNDYTPKFFKYAEFACSHCGSVLIEDELLEKLDKARQLWGRPIYVNSGYRCAKHNASRKVKGSPTSSHVKGKAADLECIGSRQRHDLLCTLLAAEFNRIGINDKKGFIHVDVDKDKDQDVIWIYPVKKRKILGIIRRKK